MSNMEDYYEVRSLQRAGRDRAPLGARPGHGGPGAATVARTCV